MEDVCIYALLASKREYQYLEVGSSVSQTITLQPEPRIVRPADGSAPLSSELASLVNAREREIRKQLHSDKYPKLPPEKKLGLDRVVARLAECARTILDDSLRQEWHWQNPVGDKRQLCSHPTPSGPCNKTKAPNQPWCDAHVPHHCSHPTPSGPCNKTKSPSMGWCDAHVPHHCSHATPSGLCSKTKAPNQPWCVAHTAENERLADASQIIDRFFEGDSSFALPGFLPQVFTAFQEYVPPRMARPNSNVGQPDSPITLQNLRWLIEAIGRLQLNGDVGEIKIEPPHKVWRGWGVFRMTGKVRQLQILIPSRVRFPGVTAEVQIGPFFGSFKVRNLDWLIQHVSSEEELLRSLS